jgi:hypothetical protein
VTAKTYGTIDGKHLWQYVKEQAEIAEHYRDQGHPQFWGRIAGTSSDIEDVDWLMKKYRHIGLTDLSAWRSNSPRCHRASGAAR